MHTAADMLLKLQEIVAERTGYPIDALPASANLESDLGIDSIKRAEILASLRSQFAADLAGRELSMEELSTAKSLQEIVNVLFPSSPPGLASKLPGELQTPSQFASQVPDALPEDGADP